MSDEQLLIESIDEPTLFAELVNRYQDTFKRKAARLVGSADLAEDIVQDTFVKIYIQAKRFEDRGDNSFRAWAHTVFIRTCLSYLRKMKSERLHLVHLDQELAEAIADEKSSFSFKFLKDEFLSILSRLPVASSRILKLRFLDGLSYEDLAKEEGVSAGAIRTRVARARRDFERVRLGLEL